MSGDFFGKVNRALRRGRVGNTNKNNERNRRSRQQRRDAFGGGGYGGMPSRGLSISSFALGAALGAGVGAGFSLWWSERRRAEGVRVADPNSNNNVTSATSKAGRRLKKKGGDASAALLDHPVLKFGMPVGSVLRPYTNFVSYFDTRTRNPHWVIERISEESSNGDGNRKFSDFREDTSIPEKLRNKLSDFRGSGYDRGHMAPASAHKLNQTTMDETFTLSNISPQVGPGFNRDYWARFEKYVKDLSKKCEEVLVVTGPLYLPQPKSTTLQQQHQLQNNGRTSSNHSTVVDSSEWEMRYNLLGKAPELTAVPTHFFKVVLTTKAKGEKGKKYAVGSFVMPNVNIPADVPLTRFVVPLDSLEKAVGTIFFPNLITAGQPAILVKQQQERSKENLFDKYVYDFDRAALKWQSKGTREMKELAAVKDDVIDISDSASSSAQGALVVASNANTAAAAATAHTNTHKNKNSQLATTKKDRVVKVRHIDHLCDTTACELPAADFWQKGPKGGMKGKGSSSTKKFPHSNNKPKTPRHRN
jgi:DNA/RNA endonuclease G (NUC1)